MGKTFPNGPTPIFPPNVWECPVDKGGCGKYHGKPHFPWPDQIDYSKKPGEYGRIVFNRTKNGVVEEYPRREEFVGKQAPPFDKDGNPLPLMCPHCGYTHEGILLVRV